MPFTVFDASAWIFKGTGLVDGSQLPGVVMSDVDHLSPAVAMPQDLEVMGPLSDSVTDDIYQPGDVGQLQLLGHDLLYRPA